jgi:hypothetical protein
VVLRCQLLYLISLQLGQAVAVLLSALIACVLALFARFAILILIWLPWGWVPHSVSERFLRFDLGWFANQLWPVPFAGTALAAFFLAFLLAELSIRIMHVGRVNGWVIRNFAGELTKLLYDSMLQIKPVSLTLDCRKFYIGFVQEIPSLDPSKAFVRLLPIVSGYRHDKTMRFKFTTDYTKALAASKDVNDYVLTIPLSTVKIANLFDPNTHQQFFTPKPTILP